MGQIVLIDTGTYKPGINNIDDIVSIHDDNVELGPASELFSILFVGGLTAVEINAITQAKVPEIEYAFRSADPINLWTLTPPQEKLVWKSGTDWFGLEEKPKYNTTLTALTAQDVVDLADNLVSKINKETILNKCEENISKNVANQTEVVELKGKIALLRAKNG